MWYDETLSKNPVPWKVKIFLSYFLIINSLLYIYSLFANAVTIIRIRKRAHELQAPSRLGVLCTVYYETINPLRGVNEVMLLFAKAPLRQKYKSHRNGNIIARLFMFIALVGLAISFLGFSLLVFLFFVCDLSRTITCFVCRGHEQLKQIQYHAHILNRQYPVLLTISIVEQLFENYRSGNLDKERILSGVLPTSKDYHISGGSFTGGEECYKVSDDTDLHSGIVEDEVIVYGNEKSIIRISNADLEDIRALTTAIKFHTGEDRRVEKITMGTIPWTVAVLNFFDQYLGPGPWPGVGGMEQSLVWLAFITVLAQLINQFLAIARLSYPLSGTTTPNKLISRWKDGNDTNWEILSDDCGTIVARKLNAADYC